MLLSTSLSLQQLDRIDEAVHAANSLKRRGVAVRDSPRHVARDFEPMFKLVLELLHLVIEGGVRIVDVHILRVHEAHVHERALEHFENARIHGAMRRDLVLLEAAHRLRDAHKRLSGMLGQRRLVELLTLERHGLRHGALRPRLARVSGGTVGRTGERSGLEAGDLHILHNRIGERIDGLGFSTRLPVERFLHRGELRGNHRDLRIVERRGVSHVAHGRLVGELRGFLHQALDRHGVDRGFRIKIGKKVIYHFVRVGVAERLRNVLEFLGLTERLGRSDAGFMELLDLPRRIADLSQVFEGELPSDLFSVLLVAVHQRVPSVVDARLLELRLDLRPNLCDAPLALFLQFAHELVAHVLDNLLQADVARGELGLGLRAYCLLRLLIGDPLLRRKTGLVLRRKEGLRRLSRHRLHHVLLGDEHGVEQGLHVVIERGPGDVLRHGVDVLKPAAVLSEGERELLGRCFTFEHVRLERAGELLMRRPLIFGLHGRPRLHVLDTEPGEGVVHGLHIRLHVVWHVLVLHDVRRDLRAHVEEKMPRLVEKRGAIGAIPTGDGAKRRKVFTVDTVLSVAHDELCTVLLPEGLGRHSDLTGNGTHLRLDERLQVARLLLRHLERTDAVADDTPHLGELVSERFARRLRRLQLDGALNVLHLLHGEGAADRHEFEDGLVLLHHRLHLADRHLDRPARGERLRHLLRHLRNTRELLVEPPLVEGVRIELDRLNARSSRHFLLVSGGSLGIELVDSRLRFAQLLHGLGVSASTLFLAGNRGARLHTRGEDFDRRGELFAHHFRHDIRPRRDLAVGKELARGFAHAAHRTLHRHLQGHVGELALVRRVEHLTRGGLRHHGDACQSDRCGIEKRRRRGMLLCTVNGVLEHVAFRRIKVGRRN